MNTFGGANLKNGGAKAPPQIVPMSMTSIIIFYYSLSYFYREYYVYNSLYVSSTT
jgi:hypothetical protein